MTDTIHTDEHYMRLALELADVAQTNGDVPVGAVIVKDGQIIGQGYNTRECEANVLGHAELNAIKMATEHLGSWRLADATLYVTLEPCLMCSGAIVQARIKRLVYGAPDKKAGMVNSVAHVFEWPSNHRPEIMAGVLADTCQAILQDFFDQRRKNQ